jgi:hypothetical protein
MRRTILITTAITASAVIAACDGSGSRSPTAPSGSEVRLELSESAARSGAVHVQKECSAYTGHAGDHCTIVRSNVDAIPVGSTVTYAKDAAGGVLDTDVILDPPQPGNNAAFGHCTLDLATVLGTCTFSGGTGMYKRFQSSVAVSPVSGPVVAWDGTYSFSGNAAAK